MKSSTFVLGGLASGFLFSFGMEVYKVISTEPVKKALTCEVPVGTITTIKQHKELDYDRIRY